LKKLKKAEINFFEIDFLRSFIFFKPFLQGGYSKIAFTQSHVVKKRPVSIQEIRKISISE
jgi:hypothetical protein